MTAMSPTAAASSAPAAVRLAADGSDEPPVSLATFRLMSDRERMMRPSQDRAALRARLMLYLPALLDHVDELAAASAPGTISGPPGDPAPRTSSAMPA